MKIINWQVTTGCERLSEGCENCPSYWEYAAKGWDYHPQFNQNKLDEPLYVDEPSIFAVSVGSDLFHEAIRLDDIRKVFEVIITCPKHRFEIITKRSERLAAIAKYLQWPDNLSIGVAVESSKFLYRLDHLKMVPSEHRVLQYGPVTGPLGFADFSFLEGVGVVVEDYGPNPREAKPEWIEQVKSLCEEFGVRFSDFGVKYEPQ